MHFDAGLLVPTFRRTRDIVAAMPLTVLAAWLVTTALGVASDFASERAGFGNAILLVYGIALTFVPLVAILYPLPFADDYPVAVQVGVNLVSAAGIVGGYLTAVALLVNIEKPASQLHEIFG